MSNAVYAIITDRVVSLLERGVVPWRRPWAGPEGMPRNLASGREYRGVNVFLLASAGYVSPNWLTFRQAQERGGSVRKGEKATPVVFWKVDSVQRVDDAGEPYADRRFILRYYNVFNSEQCEDIQAPLPAVSKAFEPIDRCESVLAGMPNAPTITHGEARAFYQPASDTVNMPRRELFDSPEAYYATIFHELTHSTGHASRLDRKGIADVATFASIDYSREELVAEMGAAFLCGHCGIEQATIENSAAYIANWLKRLRDDRTLIVQAAAQGQKAADFILGHSPAFVSAE
jgi:antirestriction protein ArdC